MARFKGRCHFRQYMPDKPTKRGFKCFSLCDSVSFYCLKFIVYTGKDYFPVPAGKPFTHHLVETLMDGYTGKSHILFCDNFYTSPALFADLREKQTGAVGTVVESRKGFPHALKHTNLPLKKGDEPVFSRSGDMVATAWHDTKRVHLLSTVHTNNTMDKLVRSAKDDGGFQRVEKPVIAETYNAYMGGVNHFDQLHKNYSYPHRSYKWYLALYHYVKDACLVNAHILYKRSGGKDNVKDFRSAVVDALIKPHMAVRKSKCRPQPNPTVDRLSAAQFGHFPAKYLDPKHRPVCKVCATIKKRAQTRFHCPQCNTALCVDRDCFRIWHTAVDVKQARQQLMD
ncbi:piggyBac transposable element-derived protein 4-like [Aplysia californica]|uniref:PiggyBac transposable element-derived protein 4-like n=1 Tax=Aplysia californica TaxID=6500 RepID=A0ABM1VZ49_APLCA|nr:piggyBac transposable element-derived protein 4-like [Aplysia californica]